MLAKLPSQILHLGILADGIKKCIKMTNVLFILGSHFNNIWPVKKKICGINTIFGQYFINFWESLKIIFVQKKIHMSPVGESSLFKKCFW